MYLWLLNAADLKESFNAKSFQRPFFPFLCYCFARIVPLLRPITCLSCGFVRRLFSGEKPDEINSNTLKTISHQSASISWKLDRISFPTCISSSNVPSQLKHIFCFFTKLHIFVLMVLDNGRLLKIAESSKESVRNLRSQRQFKYWLPKKTLYGKKYQRQKLNLKD